MTQGWPCERSDESIARVKEIINTAPKESKHKFSSETCISYGNLHSIMKDELKLHEYKPHQVHELETEDHGKRLTFCQWFSERNDVSNSLIDSVIFSDEASFHLWGRVNRQNDRYWDTENPHEIVETKKFSPHVNVWVAMSSKGIFGPYFFEVDDTTTTVNSERYIEMLRAKFLPELRRRRYVFRNTYVQHDNATPNTARTTKTFLSVNFLRKI